MFRTDFVQHFVYPQSEEDETEFSTKTLPTPPPSETF
jgi:hypothetical protein